MADLATALALVLVIEGMLYALFPDGMRRMMDLATRQPSGTLRRAGLGLAVCGIGLVWLLRG
ncbi:MAG: DUF2065 domain-containing protein [Alphaproteobacteria bacterium]|nr:DUF2065 domain-containing protein [Alphaproteobacteria bacterium]